MALLSNKKQGFISLFSGSGGLDLGLETAGLHPLLSVEVDNICQETLKLNKPKIKLSSEGDIFNISSSQIMKEAKVKRGELALLAGGPPCQPFSKSSYWANPNNSRMDDPRANCLIEFMRVANDLLPQVILIENVTGIGYSNKNDGLNFIFSEFKKINERNSTNFKPVIETLNTADFGVPQVRKRIFIIACRDGEEFKFPEPRFKSDDSDNAKLPNYRTAWDAIGDLDSDIYQNDLKLKGKWADLLPSIPEGKNYLWHTEKMGGLPLFGWRTRYWSFLLKLAKHKPSWTITASPGPATGPLHWKNRYLSVRELARLQTYPDTYKFFGSYREQHKQIGNSVPPAIGELLGLEIRRQVFKRQVRRSLRLIPKAREASCQTVKTSDVPGKYLDLIANHQEHPGVGKGPGAVKAVK
ncbi:DNA cytosine methyltransferase [Thalassotalea sediminis]|uniref:DNA cytosine methyltransferase n=1 Tax=Thalassotalea sediminis TaxID=1759089 RepID=UPI00257271D7|nr:DNA cytosine methyltransferase [Thalassotalea sediminis]